MSNTVFWSVPTIPNIINLYVTPAKMITIGLYVIFFAVPRTRCQAHRDRVLGYTEVAPAGTFVPTCTENGEYDTVQCQRRTECWCVYTNGEEIPDTRQMGRPTCTVLPAPGKIFCS